MERQFKKGFHKIKHYEYKDGKLHIQFGDGLSGEVEVSRFASKISQNPKWEEIWSSRSNGMLVVPATPHDIVIYWMSLRQFFDEEFKKDIQEKAAEQSRLVGKRLTKLREDRNMTTERVAEDAELDHQVILDAEAGKIMSHQTDIWWKILEAMGCKARDLAEEPRT